MDGLKITESEITVYVHPSQSKRIPQALKHEMNSLLFNFKYNEAFDGVVLAHVIELANQDAKMLTGVVPHFGVPLYVKLLLFSPKKGMLLDGKVEKVSQNTINVIVLGFCSVTITAENIRGELEFITKNGKEICCSTRYRSHKIKAGTMLCFLVNSWDAGTLIIAGSLVPKHTGCIRWLELERKQHATPLRPVKMLGQFVNPSKSEDPTNHMPNTINTDHQSRKLKKRKVETS